jgi:hypothetical protein
MTVPSCWNTDFRYDSLVGVTDVSTIIAAVDTALRALGWTDTSGTHVGPWISPTRADGVFMKIGMTRTSATRITYALSDQSNINVFAGTGAYLQDIDAGGTPVQIYTGPLHFCVNSQRAAQETFWCGFLDQTPDPLAVPRALLLSFNGPRTSDGTLRSYTWKYVNAMVPGATSYAQKQIAVERGASSQSYRRTVNNIALFAPAEFADSSTAPYYFLGRLFQAVTIDSTGLSYGSEVTIPLDAGVTGVFKVVACAAEYQQFIAFRKS